MIVVAVFTLIVILCGMCTISNSDLNTKGLISFMVCLFFAILLGAAIIKSENQGPTAMDVYRGKTTLQITYKDSVAVDSIVVYKYD